MKGISFTLTSVKAIQDDRKTQSRRIALPQPVYSDGMKKWVFYPKKHPTVYSDLLELPKHAQYQPGDKLYIKETYYQIGTWRRNGKTKSGKPAWKFVPGKSGLVLFENTKPTLFEISRHKEYPDRAMWYKRNARFMPKHLSRLSIEITSVKTEQVCDISHANARAEGVFPQPHRCAGFDTATTSEGEMPWCPKESTGISDCHRCAFRMQWFKLHGPTYGPECWNKWVFAYTFKKVKPQ